MSQTVNRAHKCVTHEENLCAAVMIGYEQEECACFEYSKEKKTHEVIEEGRKDAHPFDDKCGCLEVR